MKYFLKYKEKKLPGHKNNTKETEIESDVLGSYTGVPQDEFGSIPSQDADDL